MARKDPDIGGLLHLMKAREPAPGTPPPSLEQQRADNDAWGLSIPLPEGCALEALVVSGVPAERLTPRGADPGAVILYFHGGGYAFGSPRSHRHYVARLAQAAGVIALAIDYRLAPEHPFPAPVEDAVAAYRWLLEQGTQPQRIAIAGDSAGGGLTLAAALAIRAAGLPPPACLYPISPWADMAATGPSYQARAAFDPMVTLEGLRPMAASYLAGHDPADPLASPIHGDYSDFPPMLIHVGADEVLLSDAVTVAEKVALGGSFVRLEVWPEMIHVFPVFHPYLGAARRAIVQAGAWIKEHVGAN
jgi:monoterpene epsilon-lactone hydrolase